MISLSRLQSASKECVTAAYTTHPYHLRIAHTVMTARAEVSYVRFLSRDTVPWRNISVKTPPFKRVDTGQLQAFSRRHYLPLLLRSI